MKDLLKTFALLLSLVCFGFLGGVLYTKKEYVSKEEHAQCVDSLDSCVADLEDCKGDFGKCVYILKNILEEAQKAQKRGKK